MKPAQGHILLADDDPHFVGACAQWLRTAGYRVTAVPDAAGVRDAMGRATFDLLLADVFMPGNERLELLDDGRSDGTAQGWPPIIVITGEPSIDTAVTALRRQAVDYLIKPVDPEELLMRVSFAIARSRQAYPLDQEDREIDPAQALGATKWNGLSRREQEVLREFAAFPRIAEVAQRLHVSPHTARNHLKAIFRKLNVSSQVELLKLLSEDAP